MPCITEAALIELIAQWTPSANTLFAYLNAWPADYLTKPLQNMLLLGEKMPKQRVWPAFRPQRHSLRDASIMNVLREVLPLYPSIDIEHIHESLFMPLLPSTDIHLMGLVDPRQVDMAIKQWKSRITTLMLSVQKQHKQPQYSPWNDNHISNLCVAIPLLPRLKELHLTCKHASMVNLMLTNLILAITSSTISRLNLQFTYPTEWDNQMLSNLLAWLTHGSVESIVLDNVAFINNDVAPSILAKAFENSTTLKSIKLKLWNSPTSWSNVWITRDGITRSIFTKETLQLDLAIDSIAHPEIEESQTRTVYKLESQNEVIQDILSLSCCARFPNIYKITLQANDLKDDGIIALSSILPKCKYLKQLELIDQGISDVGAKVLAQALSSCPALEKVILDRNNIGNIGAMALYSSLSTIRHLSLASNPVETSGVKKLMLMMAMSQALHPTTMDLSYCIKSKYEQTMCHASSLQLPPFRRCLV